MIGSLEQKLKKKKKVRCQFTSKSSTYLALSFAESLCEGRGLEMGPQPLQLVRPDHARLDSVASSHLYTDIRGKNAILVVETEKGTQSDPVFLDKPLKIVLKTL